MTTQINDRDNYIATLDFKDLQDFSVEKLIAMGYQAAKADSEREIAELKAENIKLISNAESFKLLAQGQKSDNQRLREALNNPVQWVVTNKRAFEHTCNSLAEAQDLCARTPVLPEPHIVILCAVPLYQYEALTTPAQALKGIV